MLSRLILMTALVLAIIGVIVAVGERYPGFKFGRLPGDIVVKRDGNTLFIPITSMLAVSLLLTIGFGLLRLVKR